MSASFHHDDIFEMPAERVALNGYRLTMAGYELGDAACWDELWSCLVKDSSLEAACNLSGVIHHFIRSLRESSQRELQYFPKNCRRACSDECLVLSLLSASQNCDAMTEQFCIKALLGQDSENAQDFLGAVHFLAERMSASGLLLLPVPLQVISDLVAKTCAACPQRSTCIN
jgi:hypothetical protein